MKPQRPVSMHECQRPGCGFRFPALDGVPAAERCPRCGYPARRIDHPIPSREVQAASVPPPGPEVEVILDNIRSTFNVGAMFRAADGAGIRRIHLAGMTPTPENPRLAKTALGAELKVPWEYNSNGLAAIKSLRDQGFSLWALEGGPGTISIFDARYGLGTAAIALVVGNEISGVDPEILACCDRVVHIPMQGYKRSLNVAVAFGIAVYLLRFSPS